jgi:hypothetical protein
VGVAQCWTSAFIKDLVVHPLARRRVLPNSALVLPCRCGCIAQPLDRRRLQWVIRVVSSIRSGRRLYRNNRPQRSDSDCRHRRCRVCGIGALGLLGPACRARSDSVAAGGHAAHGRQPIARSAFQLAVPVSQVLS